MSEGRYTKAYNVNSDRKEVRLEPPLFGPFEVYAASDRAACRRVLEEHVRPSIKDGAIKEDVWAVCGDGKKQVRMLA